MSLLTEKPPVRLTVGGQSVPVCADFRVMLRIGALRETLPDDADCGREALRLFYGGRVPRDTAAAAERMLWFLRRGEQEEVSGGRQSAPPDCSFTQDAPLIYAAFRDQYGIDLVQAAFLHWWEFRALLDGLREDHRFCEVRRCRSIDLGTVQDPALRRYYREMKKRYALPLPKAEQAALEAVTAALLAGGDVQGALDAAGTRTE